MNVMTKPFIPYAPSKQFLSLGCQISQEAHRYTMDGPRRRPTSEYIVLSRVPIASHMPSDHALMASRAHDMTSWLFVASETPPIVSFLPGRSIFFRSCFGGQLDFGIFQQKQRRKGIVAYVIRFVLRGEVVPLECAPLVQLRRYPTSVLSISLHRPFVDPPIAWLSTTRL